MKAGRHSAWVGAFIGSIMATAVGCQAPPAVVEGQCTVPRIYHGLEQSPRMGLGQPQLAALVAV